MEKVPDEMTESVFLGGGHCSHCEQSLIINTSLPAPGNEAQTAIFKTSDNCSNATWNHTKAKCRLGYPRGRQHGLLFSELRVFGYFNILSIISIDFMLAPGRRH